MFIKCSSCSSKYLVNSADLKPDGRMVECANCSHQWYQEPNFEEELLSSSVPFSQINQNTEENNINNKNEINKNNLIKNLPSTVVNEKKVSIFNSILVVLLLFLVISTFWLLKKYGINFFVLLNFYINEFYFNLKLIVSDLGKIIYQIIN